MPELPDIVVYIEALDWLVLHLMIAGRLHWHQAGFKIPAKRGLAAFDFSNGSLLLTEAGSKKRASLHLVEGAEGLRTLDPGGIEVLDADFETFARQISPRFCIVQCFLPWR